MADLRKTVATAQRSMENLDAAISEVQPGLHKFSTSTMPEVDLLVRDLRTMSKSLSGVAEKLDKQGAGDRKSVVSGKSVSVRVDLGGRRIIKKNKKNNNESCT